uniref:Uncharacterized protein n=1 Tax=Micrurus spixii TaxID=129469 RepID=A0A2D4MW84_9SAUR
MLDHWLYWPGRAESEAWQTMEEPRLSTLVISHSWQLLRCADFNSQNSPMLAGELWELKSGYLKVEKRWSTLTGFLPSIPFSAYLDKYSQFTYFIAANLALHLQGT